MRNIAIILSLLLSIVLHASAQDKTGKGYFRKNNYFDAAVSCGNSQGSASLAWNHFHLIGKRGKFRFGYGARFTAYAGHGKEYITAPAKITSRQTGPQVLFSETYEESLDTVTFSSPQVNMLNLTINMEYNVYKNFDIGFNIDAAGFSFGDSRDGSLRSSNRPQSLTATQSAKPTPYNLLLVSDNDIGSLNSELFARYWFNPKWGVKAGTSFLFTEYKTQNKLLLDNDRFRNKALMLMVGITYCPFKSQKNK